VKTLRLKVKQEAWPWLRAAAKEVNFVWNWANETSEKAIRRFAGPAKFLTPRKHPAQPREPGRSDVGARAATTGGSGKELGG